MRKFLVLVAIVLLVGFLLIELSGVSICDGGYELQVQLHSASQTPIEAVRCEVLTFPHWGWGPEPDPDDAEIDQFFAKGAFWERSPSGLSWQVDLRPFRGEPFLVLVLNTHRVSVLLGRNLGYSQQRGLAVVVEYRGGKRAGTIVEIPDGRTARTLTVELP
jgi:hypothetical protein